MAKILKVKCNGESHHVNEIDLDKALESDILLRGATDVGSKTVPERLVLRCQFCAEGKVIISRNMIEQS